MVKTGKNTCPICCGELEYYDTVKRIVRTKNRKTKYILIRRLRCADCCHLHRELPNDILPYKQYESEIVIGVIEGLIDADTLGFEDYPCEMTMQRWRSQNLQILL